MKQLDQPSIESFPLVFTDAVFEEEGSGAERSASGRPGAPPALVTVRIFATHPVVRTYFTRILSAAPDIRISEDSPRFLVGIFDSREETLDRMLTFARIKYPSMRPLMVVDQVSEEESLRWALRGAWGVVCYDDCERDLCAAIYQLGRGQLWLPANVVLRLIRIGSEIEESRADIRLSNREREVLELLRRRLSNKDIAQILRISESTVKFHVRHVLRKFNVTSRHELTGGS